MSRPGAVATLRRVLAMVPWIAARGEASVAEIARAFGVSEAVVQADLAFLPFCGLPPYTPDRLIDVAVIDGYVSIRFAEYFSRPLRLTPAEGFALLAAGRTLLDVPGSDPDGPLATGLGKLARAGAAGDVLEVDTGEPGELETFRRAVGDHERLEIDYWSYSRDAVTTRRIDPLAVSSLQGHWYVAAWCHQAGDERLFRLDRVRAVRPTGERFAPRSEGTVPGDVFHPGPEDARVTVEVPPSGRWLADEVPVEGVEERAGGSLRLTLAVAAPAFLERVLLQLGPEASVVSPDDRRNVAASAARRVLRRYRS